MKRQMKIKVGDYSFYSTNTYIDNDGNYATVLRYNSGENNFIFLRITPDGKVISFQGFKRESEAFSALNNQAAKEEWKLYDIFFR